MAKKICGIYKITNTLNGKVYIGQSINVQERFYEHKRKLRLQQHFNKYLQNAYNKHGEYFEFEVIEECDVSDLDKREMYWIGYYHSDNKQNGYNIMAGGQLNRPCAEQTKALISKPVLCVETGIVYPSIAEAQRVTGLGNIGLVCNRKNRHAKGQHWCFVEDATEEVIQEIVEAPRKLPNKRVVCIETGEVFESMQDAAQSYGITPGAITQSIKRDARGRAFRKKSRPHWAYLDKEVC